MGRNTPTDAESPKLGRPRSTTLDVAIATATIELLEEHGYAGLSLAAVAERAGTTTASIYRRFSSKSDMVITAVFRTDGDDVVSDTGDLADDVRTMVRWALEKYANPTGRAVLAGLLSEPLDATTRAHAVGEVWHRMGDRLRRSIDSGDIDPTMDVGTLIVMLTGPAMAAATVHGPAAASDEWVERIASTLLDGIRA